MPEVSHLYVQTLGQELPAQDTGEALARKVERLTELIDRADAVVMGIGSGVSTSAGYDFYHPSRAFDEAFGAFERAHGFQTLFDGLYHPFSSNEEMWAFNAAAMSWMARLPLGGVYEDLARIVAGKPHFVLTTNVDGQVPRAFQPGRVWEFQGNLRSVQCSQPCTDETRDFLEGADRLVTATEISGGVPRISYDLLPRCGECRRLMVPWVRDEHFCESGEWQAARASYEAFLQAHLVEGGERVLFLEMGVSSMTPAIIKLPFWSMAGRFPQAFYVDVNVGDRSSPAQLGPRALTITADASETVRLVASKLRV
jgi:NAD-dependent SIR2 family protein deacetylase